MEQYIITYIENEKHKKVAEILKKQLNELTTDPPQRGLSKNLCFFFFLQFLFCCHRVI